jgi:chromate reductase
MTDAPLSLITLLGSLRKDSFNGALARALPALAPAGVTIAPGPSLRDIPLYDYDLQQSEGVPARAREIAEAITAADGVIFVTPEYNHSIPGVLKNAIDWLSRLDPQPFRDKPCLIQTCSQGPMGGIRCQLALRPVLVALKAQNFTTPEVIVSFARDKFVDGALKDETTRKFVATQLEAYAAFVRKVA